MLAKLGLIALALIAATYPDRGTLADATTSLPTQHQLVEIADWIASTQGLATTGRMPDVRLVTADELMRRRYGAFYRGGTMSVAAGGASVSIGGEHSTPKPRSLREVIALYDDRSRTIYLSAGWNVASPPHQSILVHEMIHHMQNQAGQRFECPAAREKPAYLAQKQWLEARGLDLTREFDVDEFTRLGNSLCM